MATIQKRTGMMAKDIVVEYKNEATCYVRCERSIAYSISDYFTFVVPGFQFNPKYKKKQWDGKIRLYKVNNGEFPVGLIPKLVKFATEYEFSIAITKAYYPKPIDREKLIQLIDSYKISSKGELINIDDYQYEVIFQAINHHRRLFVSPTSSGKSLMIYGICRALIDMELANKILVVVPRIGLAKQLFSDFEDYASLIDWNAKDHVHPIYSGQEKHTKLPIVVSTWQSIAEMPKTYFAQFDAVMVDECHEATSKSITGILEKCTNASFRCGFTGSLKESKTHHICLEGLFGPPMQTTTTKELMDRGRVAQLKITGLIIKYPHEDCTFVAKKRKKYAEEIDFIVTHRKRNFIVAKIAADKKENCLLLFNKRDQGKLFIDALAAIAPDKKVYYVDGTVDADVRETIRREAERQKGIVIVASYGVFSTGISIKNIHHVIFGSPSKSRVRVLQSIGRGLRVSSEKTKVELIDVADDLRYKKRENYAIMHFKERIALYDEQQFDYSIYPVKMTY